MDFSGHKHSSYNNKGSKSFSFYILLSKRIFQSILIHRFIAMAVSRRDFITRSALLGSSALLAPPFAALARSPLTFTVPARFSLSIMATNWGFPGTVEEFCARAKEAGYDGIEMWYPAKADAQNALRAATDQHQLVFGLLAAGNDADFATHRKQLEASVKGALAMKPRFINCHSGRDHFTFEQNRQLINFTIEQAQASGIPIYHETHRARILFAAHVAHRFLQEIPDLRLTLDISHWCNVAASLLQDQPEAVRAALQRTDHVHSRVGHAESPQVTDPRAPEWEEAVRAHFGWWDQVVKMKIDQGQNLTMTTEFGPPHYMASVPYTGQPLADQWAINVYMMQQWRERYASDSGR